VTVCNLVSDDLTGRAKAPPTRKAKLNDLILYQKVYDFLLYIYPIVAKMPKFEKFALQSHIKNCVIEIERRVIRANKSRTKLSHLYEADTSLQELKMLIRLAHDLRYIPPKQYENISNKLMEIGRLIGGMIKYAQSNKG
jgi:four helix bundle protein